LTVGKNKINKNAGGKGRATAPKHFRSLTRRIFFWMCVVALVPLIVASSQGYHCARQAVIDRAEKHLLSLLNSRKAMLLNWLEERKSDIKSISVIFDLLEMKQGISGIDETAISENTRVFFEKMFKDSNCFEAMVIFDQNGKLLLESDKVGHPASDFLTPEFESELNKTKGVVVGGSHLHETGAMGIHIGYEVPGQKGETAGYIIAYLDLSRTIDPMLLSRAGLGTTGKVYLLIPSEGRNYIYSGFQKAIVEKNSELSKILFTESQTIMEYENYRGVEVLGVSAEIPEIQCRIVVEMDQAEAFEWVYILQKRAIITVALTLVVVILIALNSSKLLSNPLRKLVEVTKKIAKGQHSERLGPMEGKEVQEVGEAFNKMLDELVASQQRMVKVASLAAVGEMSSSIVHEMRSPLSSIKLNFQALRKKVEKDPDYSNLAEMTLKQFSRLERMLADLLNYGKPMEIKTLKVNFDQLIKEVLEIVLGMIEKKKIKIKIQNKLGDRYLVVDPEQIRIALTNLLTNAVQASSMEGEIEISAEISPEKPDRAVISVIDSGPGIPEHLKEKLFKPFVTTRKEGTGLGLANVKKIVDYHAGNIIAQNRKEAGAVFIITLPAGGPSA